MTAASESFPAPPFAGRPDACVWYGGAWWQWRDGAGWSDAPTPRGACAWTEPATLDNDAKTAAEVRAYLDASRGLATWIRTTDGKIALFTRAAGRDYVRLAACSDAAPAPPTTWEVHTHPRGMSGILDSARRVAARAIHGSKSRRLIAWSRRVLHAAKLPDPRGYPNAHNIVRALFAAMKNDPDHGVSFVRDPQQTEMIADVESLMCLDPDGECLHGGDCDDQLVLMIALCLCVGILVRERVSIYPGQGEAHIDFVYQYESHTRGQAPTWHGFDPSVDDGRPSTMKPEKVIMLDLVDPTAPATFLGLGGPAEGAQTLGDTPPSALSPEESAGWAALAADCQTRVTRTAAQLRANIGALNAVRADLGFSPADPSPAPGLETTAPNPLATYRSTQQWTAEAQTAASKLLQALDFMAGAIGDGLDGKRPMGFQNGDISIGALPGDPYRVLLAPDGNGNVVPQYFDPATNQPVGTLGWLGAVIAIGAVVAVVSIAAAYASVHIAQAVAQAVHDDALQKIAANENALVASGVQTPAQRTANIKALTDMGQANILPPAADPSLGGFFSNWYAIPLALAAVALTFGIGYYVAHKTPEARRKKVVSTVSRGHLSAARKVNGEGLTFAEWYAAANAFRRGNVLRKDVARRAWLRGEDPTDYATTGARGAEKKRLSA